MIIKPVRRARNISRLLLSAPKDLTMKSPPLRGLKQFEPAAQIRTANKHFLFVFTCGARCSQMRPPRSCAVVVERRWAADVSRSCWDQSRMAQVWCVWWNASETTTLTAGNAKLTLILFFRTTPMIHLAKKPEPLLNIQELFQRI